MSWFSNRCFRSLMLILMTCSSVRGSGLLITVTECVGPDPLDLICPNSHDVDVMSVDWGRDNASITCPQSNLVANDSCVVNDTGVQLELIKKRCKEQQRCAVDANGEPCPGTSNYLSVTYTCVKWLAGVTRRPPTAPTSTRTYYRRLGAGGSQRCDPQCNQSSCSIAGIGLCDKAVGCKPYYNLDQKFSCICGCCDECESKSVTQKPDYRWDGTSIGLLVILIILFLLHLVTGYFLIKFIIERHKRIKALEEAKRAGQKTGAATTSRRMSQQPETLQLGQPRRQSQSVYSAMPKQEGPARPEMRRFSMVIPISEQLTPNKVHHLHKVG